MMNLEWITLVEVLILGSTLLTTVALSLFIALQARRHFRLQHAKEFIARFNAAEMVKVRNTVDRWLAQDRDPMELLDAERMSAGTEVDEAAIAIRTFINFFQELGVAWKHGTVHREYTWDLFAGLTAKYWTAFSPYCAAQRVARGRPTLYRDFENLVRIMVEMDQKRVPATTPKKATTENVVYLFGYGSLISPASVARTLGREPEAEAMQPVWLNGYERGWTLYDTVQFGDQSPPKPSAFLNIAEHPAEPLAPASR